jgi:pimeloyl-ACP methyl ester carboxylesterase
VLALADSLGARTFSLVGHSMGGAGVLRVLAKAPERVRKLVALTPVGAAPTPLDEAGHDLFFGAPDEAGKRFGIIDFTTGNRNTATWVQSVVDHSLTHSTVEGFRGALVAWVSPDFLDEVAGNDTPILVVPGEHDPALGLATVEQTWAPHFPNCTIEVMPNAGHYPMFETPVQLATVIERFLAD